MRVNPSVSGNIQGTQTEGLKKSESAAKPDRARVAEQLAKGQSAVAPAESEISTKGKDFAKAHSIASTVSDIREDKIAALKKRIADGDYQIDNDAIADKMIGEHAAF